MKKAYYIPRTKVVCIEPLVHLCDDSIFDGETDIQGAKNGTGDLDTGDGGDEYGSIWDD